MPKQMGVSLLEILVSLVMISISMMLCLIDGLERQKRLQDYHHRAIALQSLENYRESQHEE